MSAVKSFIKHWLDLHGWYVRRSSGLALGIDLYEDLRHRHGRKTLNAVLDVGAHRGETVQQVLQHFPDATVLAFEPITANYQALVDRSRIEKWSDVKCIQAALGSSIGNVIVALQSDSQTHSLNNIVAPGDAALHETVNVTTVDAVMNSEGILRVDLLKIDTEGYELEVLRGAESALRNGSIDLILVEATMQQGDSAHSQFLPIVEVLEGHGYAFAGAYDQVLWKRPNRVAYFNALFSRV